MYSKLQHLYIVLLIVPVLVILVAIFLWPISWGVVTSFADPKSGAPTLENYAEFFLTPRLQVILLKTVLTAFVVTAACLLVGYPLAYIFARKAFAGKNIALAIIMFPLMESVVVRVYELILFLSPHGILQTSLMNIGWIDKPFFNLYSAEGVILGLTYTYLPFAVLSMIGSIQGINPAFEESARCLGANRLQTFLRVTLPLSMPGIIAGSLLVFAISASSFALPMMLAAQQRFMLTVEIYLQIFYLSNWGIGFALANFLMIVVIAITILCQYLMRRTYA